LTQYCSENARSASAWFESSKAIMAESFATGSDHQVVGNDSNLLIVFYVQIMPDDFVMQLHRF
ncbi:hypothetical protein SB784_34775, partial [Burkholderia sp. SIMBA_048]